MPQIVCVTGARAPFWVVSSLFNSSVANQEVLPWIPTASLFPLRFVSKRPRVFCFLKLICWSTSKPEDLHLLPCTAFTGTLFSSLTDSQRRLDLEKNTPDITESWTEVLKLTFINIFIRGRRPCKSSQFQVKPRFKWFPFLWGLKNSKDERKALFVGRQLSLIYCLRIQA